MSDLLTVVTQAWLIAMGKQQFPIEPLVDPAQGLVVLDHMTDTASDDEPGIVSAKKLCGDQLAKQLPRIRKDLVAAMKHADTMECHNKPGPPFCSFGFAYEYTTMTHLIMRKADDGHLVLDAIAHLDGGSMNEDAYAEQATWVGNQLRQARAKNCAGEKQTSLTYPKRVANRSR